MKTVDISIDHKENLPMVGTVNLNSKAEKLLTTGKYILAPEIYIKNNKPMLHGLRRLSIIHHTKYLRNMTTKHANHCNP